MGLRIVLLWGLAGAAVGAIAGVAEPPAPVPLPRMWVGFGNDAFGLVTTPDDHRTNQVFVAARFGDGALVIDHSMLTSRGLGLRSDELTATVAWLPRGNGAVRRAWWAIGAGVRAYGDLAGDDIQDRAHAVLGAERFDLEYEGASTHGVAYGMSILSARPPSWLNAQAVSSLLATSGGEVQAELAGWVVLQGRGLRLWAGPRLRLRGGDPPTRTADEVADHERGVWIDYGLSIHRLSLSGGYDPHHDLSLGQIVFSFELP